MRIYLDHNATTPMDPQVREISLRAMELAGNPSSVHAEGRATRSAVEAARRQVAELCAAEPGEIVFTSGGTEADCLGIIGLARLALGQGRPRRVLSTAIEHPAVHGALAALAAEGISVARARVDGRGVLDLDALRATCSEAPPAILAISAANHELGTLADIPAAAEIARAAGALIHVDAVQAAGKIPLAAIRAAADSMAISAHKFYGPKGVGALWVRDGLSLPALFEAGHQERERRPGTENVVGIVGMGAAAELAARRLDDDRARICELSAYFEEGLREGLRAFGPEIHAADAPRIGNTVNARFPGALGETVVAALDLAGFAVSTGAACTSGSVEPSPVLLGIGLTPERAVEAVRFSLGRGNQRAHIDALLAVLPDIIARARRFR